MRKATVTYSFRDNKRVPMIRLRGDWLVGAGFETGMLLAIVVESGRLILAPAEQTTGGTEMVAD
jgi:hypothetical protein